MLGVQLARYSLGRRIRTVYHGFLDKLFCFLTCGFLSNFKSNGSFFREAALGMCLSGAR